MFLKTLSFITLFVLFALISIGGYVSASGVGLTCPDWPMCPSGFVPGNDFIIEYFHRAIAATTGLLVIINAAFTLKSRISPKPMKIAAIVATAAVVGQIALGALVIVERLEAVLVTVHLGLGMILFSMILMITLYSHGLEKSMEINQKRRNKGHSNLSYSKDLS